MRTLPSLALLIASLVPWPIVAQSAPTAGSSRLRIPEVRPVAERPCSASDRDPLVRRVETILGAGPVDDSLAVLRSLERSLRSRTEDAPDDAEARFRLATVIGVRLELDDGEEIELASELHRHASHLVAVEPGHAGAHHMLGRLHAAVMRLGGFKRFLAKTFVGGELLDRASWAAARRHLELAEALEPCIPDHHYELARLLFERGRSEDAVAEIEHVRALRETPGSRGRAVARKADALAASHREGTGRMP